jgi:lipoprotein-anchoring transpeptidase ErfK/SrfK
VALALAPACSGERPSVSEAERSPEEPPRQEPRSTTTTTTAPENEAAEVATAKGASIEVYPTEDGATPVHRLVAGVHTSLDRIPIVMLVKSRVDAAERAEVHLPVRPNGSTGWVDLADVDIRVVTFRLEVRVSEHRLLVYDGDDVIFDEPVGVGRRDRPTPGGTYYLKELLQPPDPGGVYGVYAYGLSGFQPVLDSFNGREPVIGIHGTNDPSSVGRDVSSGCIRLQNAAIDRLVNEIGLPLGTPVEIVA